MTDQVEIPLIISTYKLCLKQPFSYTQRFCRSGIQSVCVECSSLPCDVQPQIGRLGGCGDLMAGGRCLRCLHSCIWQLVLLSTGTSPVSQQEQLPLISPCSLGFLLAWQPQSPHVAAPKAEAVSFSWPMLGSHIASLRLHSVCSRRGTSPAQIQGTGD